MSKEAADDLAVQIGAKVAQQRKQRGRSVNDLAKALGISPQQLGLWEAGRQRIPPATLANIIEALGCDVSAILGDLAEPSGEAETPHLRLVAGHDSGRSDR